MNLFQCVETAIIAEMDKHAFDLNMLIQNQNKDNSRDKFMAALDGYAKGAAQMEVLEKVKEQVKASMEQTDGGQVTPPATEPMVKRQHSSGIPPEGWADIPDDIRETFEKYQGKFERGEDYTDEVLGTDNES